MGSRTVLDVIKRAQRDWNFCLILSEMSLDRVEWSEVLGCGSDPRLLKNQQPPPCLSCDAGFTVFEFGCVIFISGATFIVMYALFCLQKIFCRPQVLQQAVKILACQLSGETNLFFSLLHIYT